jgi:hypothetical protein
LQAICIKYFALNKFLDFYSKKCYSDSVSRNIKGEKMESFEELIGFGGSVVDYEDLTHEGDNLGDLVETMLSSSESFNAPLMGRKASYVKIKR